MTVDLLVSPDCPNAAAARASLTDCLHQLGLSIDVQEHVGDYASPTILIDGVDVVTGQRGVPPLRACRLDLPTAEHLLAALHRVVAQPPG